MSVLVASFWCCCFCFEVCDAGLFVFVSDIYMVYGVCVLFALCVLALSGFVTIVFFSVLVLCVLCYFSWLGI